MNIDFNKTAGYGYAGIPPTSIKPVVTNHGEVWFINALSDDFQAIIFDGKDEILIKDNFFQYKKPSLFLFMDQGSFDDYYKGKTIEEVEREGNIKLFIDKDDLDL